MAFTNKELSEIANAIESQHLQEQKQEQSRLARVETFVDGTMLAWDYYFDLVKEFHALASSVGRVRPVTAKVNGRFLKKKTGYYLGRIGDDGSGYDLLFVTVNGELYRGHVNRINQWWNSNKGVDDRIKIERFVSTDPLDCNKVKMEIRQNYMKNHRGWEPTTGQFWGLSISKDNHTLHANILKSTYNFLLQADGDGGQEYYLQSLEKLPIAEIKKNVKRFVLELAGLKPEEAHRAMTAMDK